MPLSLDPICSSPPPFLSSPTSLCYFSPPLPCGCSDPSCQYFRETERERKRESRGIEKDRQSDTVYDQGGKEGLMRDRMTPAAAPPVVPFSSEIDSHLVSIAVEPNCSLQTNDGPTCHAVVACSFIHMTGNSAIQHHLLPREREREKGDDVFSCHLQLTCYIVGKEDMASAFHLLLNLQVI